MRLRPHPRGVRGEAEGAHPTAECGAETLSGPGAQNHAARGTHKKAAADLRIHEITPRRNELQHHREGDQGDPAHRGQALRNDLRDTRANVKNMVCT